MLVPTPALRRVRFSALLGLCLSVPLAPARAQAPLSGSVRGRTTDVEGHPLGGVTIGVRSRLTRKVRSTTSTTMGTWTVHGLESGVYDISFILADHSAVERPITVESGRVSRVDAEMELSGDEEETVIILLQASPEIETRELGSVIEAEEADRLAVGRAPHDVVRLVPGISEAAPRPISGQVSLRGGPAWDLRFVVDGGDASDVVRGTLGDVADGRGASLIDDTVSVVHTLTGNLPAEYGRSGGVVQVLTRGGPEDLGGSLRLDLTHPRWLDATPFEVAAGQTPGGELGSVLTAAFAGPMLDERWRFAVAGERGVAESESLFGLDGGRRHAESDDDRLQTKVHGHLGERNRVTLSAAWSAADGSAASRLGSVEASTVDRTSSARSRFAGAWDGLWSPRLTTEVRVSGRRYRSEADPIAGSGLETVPFFTLTQEPAHYNGPVRDPELPSLEIGGVFSAGMRWFTEHRPTGTHDLSLGIESSSTDYRDSGSEFTTPVSVRADILVDASGAPIRDAAGRLQPLFEPGRAFLDETRPGPGDIITRRQAAWAQDRWSPLERAALLLGGRVERVRVETLGTVVSDSIRAQPRLGLSLDLRGDGSFRLEGGLARYAGSLNPAPMTRGGGYRASWAYDGPVGSGFGFAPGLDPANYTPSGGDRLTGIGRLDDALFAPVSEERTLALSGQLGPIGFVELAWMERRSLRAFEDRLAAGAAETVATAFGPRRLDTVAIESSERPRRLYEALELHSAIRLRRRLTAHLHWTHVLADDGDADGESADGVAATSLLSDYPGVWVDRRSEPFGRFAGAQRDRALLWATWRGEVGRHAVQIGALYRFDSARAFVVAARAVPLTAAQAAAAAALAAPPTAQRLVFGDRAEGQLGDSHLFDLAVRWDVEMGELEPWLKIETRNLFNHHARRSVASTVLADPSGPVDGDGLALDYVPLPGFGEARRPEDFVRPRELRVSLGLRF